MRADRIRQFKLVTGDEIICEVLEWDDNESAELVVQKIYKIEVHDNHNENTRYYALKPYLSFQLDDGLYQTLNCYHIAITALPSTWMINQYQNLRIQEENNADELMDKKLNKLKQLMDSLDLTSRYNDSDNSKIISLFGNRDKMH